jgi:hypothetical protein
MSNGGNPREPEIPSPDQHEVPDPGHRYDALQVLQTMMELQKDITMIATKTDRLIVSFLGSKLSSSDEERLEPFFGHRLTP